MLILLGCLGLLLVFSLVFYCGNQIYKRDSVFLILSFIILWFVHVFKDGNSFPDLPQYLSDFWKMPTLNWDYLINRGFWYNHKEPAYNFLVKCISVFSDSSLTFFAITSSIILLGYYLSIKRYSLIPWLSVLIFFLNNYGMSLLVLRQFMAMSICYISIKYVLERKIWSFVFLLLLAFLFHQTAIIFFPIYFLYGIKSQKRLFIYLSLFGILAFVYVRILFMFSTGFLKGYDVYLAHGVEGTNYTGFFILLCVFIYRIYVLKSLLYNSPLDRFFSLILSIGLIISFVGVGYNPTTRLNMYYSDMVYLIMPNTLSKDSNINSKYIVGFLYCGLIFYRFISGDLLERYHLCF